MNQPADADDMILRRALEAFGELDGPDPSAAEPADAVATSQPPAAIPALSSGLAERYREEAARLRDELDRARRTESDLQAQLAALRSDDDDTRARLAQAEADLAARHAVDDRAGSEAAELRADLAELEGRMHRLLQTLADREDELHGREARITELQDRLRGLESSRPVSHAGDEQVVRLRAELAAQSHQVRALQELADEFDPAGRELEAARSRIAELEAQSGDQLRRLNEAERRVRSLDAIEEQLTAREAEVAQLQEMLLAAEQRHASEVAAIVAEFDAVRGT